MPLLPPDARLSGSGLDLGSTDLEFLLRHWQAYQALLACVGLIRDARLVDAAVRSGKADLELLRNHELVKQEVEGIYLLARNEHSDLVVTTARITSDVVHACDAFTFVSIVEGQARETRFDFEYLESAEWETLNACYLPVGELGSGPLRLATGGACNEYASAGAALRALGRHARSEGSLPAAQPERLPVPAVPVFEWADQIDDAGARSVFVHLAQHASVTEAELAALLGSPRAARQFALSFETHAAKVPFSVRIETADDVKRYVKEGEK